MRFWLPALAGWAAVIFLLSSIPNPPGAQGSEWRSIVGHLVEYSVLAFLAAKVLELWRPGWGWLALAAGAWLFAVAYGMGDEFHQSFVPRRNASGFDVLMDGLGALAGITAWAWMRASNAKASGPLVHR